MPLAPPSPDAPVRIAMWCGPRCRSTALLRAWQSRPDTAAADEPLYGVFLAHTEADHPARQSVLDQYPTDWRDVAADLAGLVPGGRPVFYQKHMGHHLLPHVGREWLDDPSFRHAFLIRDPAALVVSLDKVFRDPGLADVGLPQQVELFERFLDRDGAAPPIVDADDLLRDPEGMLRALCARLGVGFDPAMLSWEPGRRETDKTWTEHWYQNVWRSTGFGTFAPRAVAVPDRLRPTVEAARTLYDRLAGARLRAEDGGPGTEDGGAPRDDEP